MYISIRKRNLKYDGGARIALITEFRFGHFEGLECNIFYIDMF